jgi:hypothetical protein
MTIVERCFVTIVNLFQPNVNASLILLRTDRDPFPLAQRSQSMSRKSGNRFSEMDMRQQRDQSMSRKSGNRFSEMDMRQQRDQSMSRKRGNRFSEEDMPQHMNLERIPIQPNRDTL